MVRSGLNLDPQQKKEIRVSPYRLATHLSMAFTTYVLLLWTALDVLHDEQAARSVVTRMSLETMKYARRIRSLAVLGGCLAATTVVSGAYVAGNDAGKPCMSCSSSSSSE
jgi:cytochrome c oxidase assembly protein subunit 15